MIGAFLGILMVYLLLLEQSDGYSPEEDGINILCPESGKKLTSGANVTPKVYSQTCNPVNTASIIQIFLIETFATGVFVSQIISLKYNS